MYKDGKWEIEWKTFALKIVRFKIPVSSRCPDGGGENGGKCLGHNEDWEGDQRYYHPRQNLQWYSIFTCFAQFWLVHLVVGWKKLTEENKLKWTGTSSCKIFWIRDALGIPGPICGPGCLKLSANLIDVSLSYEDTNSLQTDDFNRTTIGIVAMQVAQPGDQTCN